MCHRIRCGGIWCSRTRFQNGVRERESGIERDERLIGVPANFKFCN